MKKIRSYWNGIWQALSRIHLVDKILILFMAILMIQSAYSLFAKQSVSSDIDHIDVVVRTSMAAIFGYFLSANFIYHTSSGSSGSAPDQAVNLLLEEHGHGIQNRIGFSGSSSGTEMETGNASVTNEIRKEESPSSRLQIIAAASIGLFCLVVLIMLRNFSGQIIGIGVPVSASVAATVTQFRDFVSGCIGFLIGCPTSARNFK